MAMGEETALGLATTFALATEVCWTWRQEAKAAYNEMVSDFTKLEIRRSPSKFESSRMKITPPIVSTALACGHGGDVIHTPRRLVRENSPGPLVRAPGGTRAPSQSCPRCDGFGNL